MEEEGRIRKSIENILYNLQNAGFTYEGETKEIYNNIKKYNDTNKEVLDFVVKNNENIKCFINYRTFTHINKNNLKEIVHTIKEDKELNTEDFIVIILNDYTLDTIQSFLKTDAKFDNYVHLFNLYSLQFKILEHKYVPKHIKLTDDEKKEFYNKYNITNNSQIPEISRFDPVANAIFLKPGDVCKILRYEKASFLNEYYRYCI
jgi:DNA-directed RNA polymerase subunit H (RpoH/RPB5)